MLGVFRVGPVVDSPCGIDVEIAAPFDLAGLHRYRAATFELVDVAIKSGGRVKQHPGQVHADHLLIRLARHRRLNQDLVWLGSADEGATITEVEERLHAGDIARAEELALAPVPQGEDKIAENFRWRLFAPALVRAQNDFRVGAASEPQTLALQHLFDFVAIVDTPVHRQGEARLLVDQRLALAYCLRRCAQHRMAERHSAAAPRVETVSPAIGDGFEHRSDEPAVYGAPIKVVNCGDSAHRMNELEKFKAGISLSPRFASTGRVGVSPNPREDRVLPPCTLQALRNALRIQR